MCVNSLPLKHAALPLGIKEETLPEIKQWLASVQQAEPGPADQTEGGGEEGGKQMRGRSGRVMSLEAMSHRLQRQQSRFTAGEFEAERDPPRNN